MNTVRCSKCTKKKSTIIEKCKCDNYFCLNCLPFFNHDCKFDWRKDKKDYLNKTNPKIIAIKVNDI